MPKDEGFIQLVTLKAACILVGSEARAKALVSFKVKDGPSIVETKDAAINVKKLADDLCKKFEDAKLRFQLGWNAVHLLPYL